MSNNVISSIQIYPPPENYKKERVELAKSAYQSAKEYMVIALSTNLKTFHYKEEKIFCSTSSNVIASFACELFLKAILYSEADNDNKIRMHFLDKLYGKLSEDTKQEIASQVNLFNVPSVNIGVKQIRKIFTEFRYSCELPGTVINIAFLYEFMESLERVCRIRFS